MCRGVPVSVPIAASLSGTTRRLKVLVLVSLTSRRWMDTCDRLKPSGKLGMSSMVANHIEIVTKGTFMYSVNQAVMITALSGLVALTPALAAAQGCPPGYACQRYQQYQPTTMTPNYNSTPRLLPNTDSMAGSTFRPSAPPNQSPVGCFFAQPGC